MTEGSLFCPKCGNSTAPATGSPQTAAASTFDPDPKSGSHKKAGLVALILMALSAIGFVFVDTVIIKPANTVTSIFGHEASSSLLLLATKTNNALEKLNDVGIGFLTIRRLELK